MRLHVRASRMVFFAGFKMQRDWILERNKESNKLYKTMWPQHDHLSRYTEKFIL